MINKKKIDVIWNITSICMWDCGVCCVDATHVSAKNQQIFIKSQNLETIQILKKQPHGCGKNLFDQALDKLVEDKLELTLQEKFQVLDNLKGFNAKIDFSGGDPFAISHTKLLIKYASQLFGKHNVTVTATGAGITRINIAEIAPFIGELNFTYDSAIQVSEEHRPNGYATSNLKQAAKFSKYGVLTRGETPLTTENIDSNMLTQIYLDLHKVNVSTHLIMRLFPSGRGVFLKHKVPTLEQYTRAIDLLYSLEDKYKYPKIKLQCALKYLDPRRVLTKNPCDMVTESFGLMPNGTLLASPWAIGHKGQPVSSELVLGNLVQTTMADILGSDKVTKFTSRADENFGHCKMQAFFSVDKDREAILFKKVDPLYDTE